MSRWFRMYADQIRNPKVMRLSDSDFRMWVDLMSLASENNGRLPPVSDLARMCHKRAPHLARVCATLVSGGLLDPDGDGFIPHNWKKRQYKSDTSTERVQKFRRFRNVSGTVNETPPESESESEIPLPNGKGPKVPILEVPVIETPEFKLYRRGKEILGVSSGGQIKRLRAAVGGDVALARAALETASTKHDPAEYIGGVIRSRNRESYGGAADDLIT